MIWRKRPAARKPAEAPTTTGPSAETRRARAAAREAAIQLDKVRAQREEIERGARELDDLNRHNGFYRLIQRALEA